MKKIIAILLLCILCACSNVETTRLKPQGIEEISYSQLSSNMKKDVEFILYIGRPDCGDCMAFEPYLKKYLEEHNGSGVYYLNIKSYRDKARSANATKKEKEFFNNLYKTFDFDWTPTVEIITNGKIVKKYQYLDEDYYEIKDRSEQIKKRDEFVEDFYDFMDDYYKES